MAVTSSACVSVSRNRRAFVLLGSVRTMLVCTLSAIAPSGHPAPPRQGTGPAGRGARHRRDHPGQLRVRRHRRPALVVGGRPRSAARWGRAGGRVLVRRAPSPRSAAAPRLSGRPAAGPGPDRHRAGRLWDRDDVRGSLPPSPAGSGLVTVADLGRVRTVRRDAGRLGTNGRAAHRAVRGQGRSGRRSRHGPALGLALLAFTGFDAHTPYAYGLLPGLVLLPAGAAASFATADVSH